MASGRTQLLAAARPTRYTSTSRFSQRHDQPAAIHLSEPRACTDDRSHFFLHGLRIRTRKVLAVWSEEGTHVDLRDIRLIRSEYRPTVGDLPIEMALLGLDRRLRPAVMWDEINRPDLLDDALAKLRSVMDRRHAMHRALSRQGADGLVDQLVVNAIATHMDVGVALRQIASGLWPALPGSLAVFDEKGRLRCHGNDPAPTDFGWNRYTITLSCSATIWVRTHCLT